MKKFLLVVGLVADVCGTHSCVFGTHGYCRPVRLPDRQAVERIIAEDAGFPRFAEKSTLAAELADKDMTECELEEIIAVAINKYIETLQSPIASVQNGYDQEAYELKSEWRDTILWVLAGGGLNQLIE